MKNNNKFKNLVLILIFILFFSSLYGLIVMVIANIFLVIRIQIEEEMLIVEFGEKYIEYKKNTKKLIPYIY